MKIAILADIHGNLIALNAILKKLELLNISHIIVAGDHISDCPSPTQVIDKLINHKALCIKGNREHYILDPISDEKWPSYRQFDSILWTKKQLRKNHFDWIKKLPEHLSIKIEKTDSIKVVHGSPMDVHEHLYKEKPDRLIEVLNNIDEKVLICGHSHLPWSTRIRNKLVINPGSVGVSFNKTVSADFAIMTWEMNKWNVEHMSEPYNIDELIQEYKSSGLYEQGGTWGKLIIKSLKEGRNCNIDFIRLALENKKKSIYMDHENIPNVIWEETIRQYWC